ncbi:MAG: helix-turn-helix domain-containing protein [Clostridiales bacterium]|nr:helix-turn-helix domain-containing protein [Clostridiales bacterium]
MDQVKIGKFIATCRKEKGLTQMQLAEKLNITNRAVSKWETGKSMPDVSIMPELCSELDINVNELLSGERIPMENYRDKAEEKLLELQNEDFLSRMIRKLVNSSMLKVWQYIMVIVISALLIGGSLYLLFFDTEGGIGTKVFEVIFAVGILALCIQTCQNIRKH